MSRLLDQLISILEAVNSYAFVKMPSLEYYGGNKRMLNNAKVSSLAYKTDYDLPWAMFADKYRQDDKKVLQGNIIDSFEVFLHEDVIQLARVQKIPIYENTKIIGIAGYTYPIAEEKIKDEQIDILRQHKNIIVDIMQLTKHYKILSKRQIEILVLTTHGHSAKSAALILNLSPKTIDSHLEVIKAKLNCVTKKDIITFSFNNGLHLLIPNTLANFIDGR